MIKCSDISKSDTRYKTEIETKIILTLCAHRRLLHDNDTVVNVRHAPLTTKTMRVLDMPYYIVRLSS